MSDRIAFFGAIPPSDGAKVSGKGIVNGPQISQQY